MGVKNPLARAMLGAAFRIAAVAVAIYIASGAILFPAWWKDFFVNGGFAKSFFWRDAFGYLFRELRQMSPLGFTIILGLLLIFGYILFWMGKHAAANEKLKAEFFKSLPPSKRTLIFLTVASLAILTVACLQPASYSEAKGLELFTQILTEKIKRSGYWEPSMFAPPESGTYLYLNEKVVMKQFQAFQSDLEPKQKTDKLGKEQDASATLSLPVGGANLSAGGKVSKEQTLTFDAPERSPNFAIGRLIKRFVGETNTIKWSLFSPFGSSSEYLIRALTNSGVELTTEQVAKLRQHDKTNYISNVAKILKHKILLYEGTIHLRKSGERLFVEFTDIGPVKVRVSGQLEKQFLADAMLFAFEGRDQGRDLSSVDVLAIIEDKQTDSDGNIEITITPECIW